MKKSLIIGISSVLCYAIEFISLISIQDLSTGLGVIIILFPLGMILGSIGWALAIKEMKINKDNESLKGAILSMMGIVLPMLSFVLVKFFS